jgi:hypothetical protein
MRAAGGAGGRQRAVLAIIGEKGALMHADAGRAQMLGAALDQYGIVQPGGGVIAQGNLRDGPCPLPRLIGRTLINAQQAQHVGSGALEPAQVIGVIHHPRHVGVLEIGAHGKAMQRPIETAPRRRGSGACGDGREGRRRHDLPV